MPGGCGGEDVNESQKMMSAQRTGADKRRICFDLLPGFMMAVEYLNSEDKRRLNQKLLDELSEEQENPGHGGLG